MKKILLALCIASATLLLSNCATEYVCGSGCGGGCSSCAADNCCGSNSSSGIWY